MLSFRRARSAPGSARGWPARWRATRIPRPRQPKRGRDAEPLRRLLPLPPDASGLVVEDDGSIVYDSGDCRAVIAVSAVNFDALAPEDQEFVCRAYNRLIANALLPGQPLQLVVESHPLRPDAVVTMAQELVTTAHPTLRALAADALEHLRSEMARTYVPDRCGYLIIGPGPDVALGLAGVVAGVKDAAGLGTRGTREPDRAGLDDAVDDIMSVAKDMGIRAFRLGPEAVLDLLWRATRPGEPTPPALRDARLDAGRLSGLLAPIDWHEAFDHVRTGPAYQRSVVVRDPADLTSPGWLDEIVSLGCSYRLSWHLLGRDRDGERKRVVKRHTRFTKVGRTRAISDPDTDDAATEALALAETMLNPSVGIVSSALILTLVAPDLAALDEATRQARRVLRTRLAVPHGIGRGYQGPLWRAGLPYGVDVSRRARRWHSYSVANGLPFLSHSPGTPRGFPLGYTTRGRELVVLHLSDPSLPTWAVTVNGRQGSGKTFLTQLFTLHTLLEGGRATIIDRAGHYRWLIDLAGGAYIGLSTAAPPVVNLWDLRPGETLAQKVSMVHAAHEIMLCPEGGRLSGRLDAALERAIRAVYAERGISAGHERPLLGAQAPRERDLAAALDRLADDADAEERPLYREIRDLLHSYTGEGRYAHLVDRYTAVDLETALLCWDFEGVDEALHPLLMYVIGYAMSQRAQNTYARRGDRHPELLVIDEGWYLARYAGAGKWLEDTARRTRHMGLRFVFTTQQLSDMINHPAAVSVFNAAAIKCLFRQHDAQDSRGDSTMEWLAKRLQISLAEAKSLTQLGNGQMMLVREAKDGSYKRGLVDVRAAPCEYWLFTSEPDRDVPAKIAAVEAAGGDVWAAIRQLAATQPRR